MTDSKAKPTLFQALIPIIFLIIMLFTSVKIFGDAAIEGANQMSLLMAAAVAGLVAVRLGYSWTEMQTGINA